MSNKTYWTMGGKIIVDGDGKWIKCDHCPCTDTKPYYAYLWQVTEGDDISVTEAQLTTVDVCSYLKVKPRETTVMRVRVTKVSDNKYLYVYNDEERTVSKPAEIKIDEFQPISDLFYEEHDKTVIVKHEAVVGVKVTDDVAKGCKDGMKYSECIIHVNIDDKYKDSTLLDAWDLSVSPTSTVKYDHALLSCCCGSDGETVETRINCKLSYEVKGSNELGSEVDTTSGVVSAGDVIKLPQGSSENPVVGCLINFTSKICTLDLEDKTTEITFSDAGENIVSESISEYVEVGSKPPQFSITTSE